MNSYQNFKDRVRREVSIESYIGRFVPLKRSGRNYIGLCPFHNEKTPSFHVKSDSGYYHCFGCKASGDIFRFVMDYQKVDFPKSLEILSEYTGIPLVLKSKEEEEEDRKKEALYQFNERVRVYFQKNFQTSAGEVAMKYLLERGLYEDEVRIFGIGYALPGFQNLAKDFIRSEAETKMAEALGLLKRQDQNRDPYDFFRNRIMFPVIDARGRTIAFSGRILGNSEEAKYINSPNSSIYDKSRSFYNLNLAQDSIRKTREVIVVEGVFDAVGLFRKGIESVVAPLGTSFTDSHARILKNMADRVILMMDADAAGAKGAFRAVTFLNKEGIDVRIAQIPEGKDPFDYSLKHNKSEIRDVFERSQSASQFMIQQILAGATVQSLPETKQAGIRKLMDFVKTMEKETDKQVYLQEGAKQLGISFSAIFQDFQGKTGESSAPTNVDTKRTNAKLPEKKAEPIQVCERKMLAKLVQNQELFEYSEKILEMDFYDESASFLWDYLYTKYLQGEPISVAEILSKEDIPKEYLGELAGHFDMEPNEESSTQRKSFQDLILLHRKLHLEFQMNQLFDKMGNPQLTVDQKKEVLSEITYLKSERDKIWEYLRTLQVQEV
ncbi:DNA primase [Leptospira ryugenii]|uniref:DNA primase n=1 Tax=Leptospira ryugenii TaxID=1917863 RepID=A0A2P2DWF5_9LEPT|nr:DNA primase [Leptospira ryugenii]GBF48963.1 DNA primase [Leptospira ryugenii]